MLVWFATRCNVSSMRIAYLFCFGQHLMFFEKPASSEALTTSYCCLVQVFAHVFFSSIQEARGPRHKPADCSGANENPLHTQIVHGGEKDPPLHKFVVCGEPTL